MKNQISKLVKEISRLVEHANNCLELLKKEETNIGLQCVHCNSFRVHKHGKSEKLTQRYKCMTCKKTFPNE